jgi:preprotein translocase subunit YajC
MSDDPLNAGDWVRAQSGHVGKVILISRLSAFVDVHHADKTHTMTFLLSELNKIAPPQTGERPPTPASH